MKPKLSYLICTTPRSGSTLLSSIMGLSGLAGYPWEWFDPKLFQKLSDQIGASDYPDYLEKVLEKGATANGVFGAKVMADHFYTLLRSLPELPAYQESALTPNQLLNQVFPNLKYIWLTRRDKVRQAISFEKARQTGIWRSHSNLFQKTAQEPIFNFEAIDHWVKYIIDQEFAWQEYFSQADITPLTLVYEDFYQFPEETVRQVLAYLNIPVPDDWKFREAQDQKLADETTEAWAKNYAQQLNAQLQFELENPVTTQKTEKKELSFKKNKSQVVPQQTRLIAFYLPQYHPIPENDAWWGQGFTEWTNVAKAQPLFEGHYQPHLPADLGFYDLRLPEARQAQADLAQAHGIYGFCYYHYWFNGRRLLNRPLDEMLASSRPDMPFCLCWANENWTRAWDGLEREILIGQKYSPEDDRQHLHWLADVFRDERYIRINGKPLFLVYRVSKLPNPLQTTTLWREEAHKLGLGELYLSTVESLFDDRVDPTRLGFDAAVEFQPDWPNLPDPLVITADNGRVYDYAALVKKMLQRDQPAHKRFPCVVPGWDNTPRRHKNSGVLANSTPELYQDWLETILQKFIPPTPDENLIFINAWNEWGEGAHLEPCQKWGRAYLVATQQALQHAQPLVTAASSSLRAAQPQAAVTLSVCIPTYNGAKYLGEAISSILQQTQTDFELLIVDDCSRDDTEAVARSFDDARIQFIKNPVRLGLVGNWNRCLDLAQGKYICVFHQDDLMLPENLAQKVKILDEHPQVGMVYSNVYQIGPSGNILSEWWYFKPDPTQPIIQPGPTFFEKLLRGVNIVCCPSVVIRRECYEQLGGFDAQLPFTADWEMWLRLALFYDIAYLPEGLVKYRRHEDNETLNFMGAKAFEHGYLAKMRVLEKYPERLVNPETYRIEVTKLYQQQALEQTIIHYQQRENDAARQYLALAVDLNERFLQQPTGHAYAGWLLEIANRLKTSANGLPPASLLELPFEVQQEFLGHLSGEEIARRIPIQRVIQAIAFKLGNQPGLSWLYNFRGFGKKILRDK